MDRRQFLLNAGSLALLGELGALRKAFAQSTDNHAGAAITKIGDYTVAPWKGDDFTLGHALREGEIPEFPDKAERTVDFVIVGGGIAGLTCAHYLRSAEYLLLEQYDEVGGQSRGGSYNGIDYSYGAAYIGDLEGEIASLVSDLGLHAYKLEPERNSWRWENAWVPGISGEGKDLYKHFQKLKETATPVWQQLRKASNLVPLSDPDLVKLDGTPFKSILEGYDEQFISLIDAFLKSCNCLGAARSSALAAFSTLSDLVDPTYVFKGGNSAFVNALAAKPEIRQRCITNSFVWSVGVKDGGASVVYTTKDKVAHRVDCRFVIMAIPPMVSARVISGIADEAKASMLRFRYGSYLVANILLKKDTFHGAFDNWVTQPFSFADIIDADKRMKWAAIGPRNQFLRFTSRTSRARRGETNSCTRSAPNSHRRSSNNCTGWWATSMRI